MLMIDTGYDLAVRNCFDFIHRMPKTFSVVL